MKQAKKISKILFVLTLMGVLLLACSSTNSPSEQTTENTKENESATRKYTDYMGHEVEIPKSPQRIVFSGETVSDLLALGVDAVGVAKSWVDDMVYEDQFKNIDDIGFPISLEKTLELKPDLIIVGNTDEKEFEQLSKIAPTIMFDTFAPLDERLQHLGDLVDKKSEAESWIAEYKVKEEDMWSKLKAAGVKPNETVSVFTYYPGDRLFIMARTGLSQVLYQPNGFSAPPLIQKVLDANTGFEQISLELLNEYAGDRIFLLTPVAEEAKKSTDEMLKSKIWLDLPAVKNDHVYTIDILKSGSDALTREWLLNELPLMITN